MSRALVIRPAGLSVVPTAVHVATSLPLMVPCGVLRFFIATLILVNLRVSPAVTY